MSSFASFVYQDRSWKSFDGGLDIPSNSDKFSCKIFLPHKNACWDSKIKRSKHDVRVERKKLMERLERLSKPKKALIQHDHVKIKGVPLERLLPRISKLAQPKYMTPKYVKPKDEPFQLPGAIQDWEAHKRWLEMRARPKKVPSRFCVQHVIRNIERDGWRTLQGRRLHSRCKTKSRYLHSTEEGDSDNALPPDFEVPIRSKSVAIPKDDDSDTTSFDNYRSVSCDDLTLKKSSSSTTNSNSAC